METKNKFAAQKKILEERKTKLLEEIEKNRKTEEFGNDVDDFDEETDEAEEFGNARASAQTLKDDINEIDAALRNIELGTYGVCSRCKKKIEDEVLRAAPESALCKSCKKELGGEQPRRA